MRSRRRPGAALVLALSLLGRGARADDWISDPVLTGEAPKASSTPGTAGKDETIVDPELQGAPATAGTTSAAGFSSRPEYPHDAIFRTTLATRLGVDTDWDRPSQDVFEGTTIAALEVEQRRSAALLLSVGLRARHAFGMRKGGATYTELDVVPLSAFADVTPADGYHVRAGYQTITMGRFDLFSATNFLAVYDIRSGPVTMPDAAAVGQPALRFDFDKISGLSIQAYYLPFFVPDLVTVYGTDYAILASADRWADASPPAVGAPPPPPRSTLVVLSTSGIRAFAPAPNLTTPQGAIRANLNGSAGELAATVGTALERLPTIEINQTTTNPADLLIVHHDRFGVASIDAATDVGPVQFGFEGAYEMHRTLVGAGAVAVPGPPPTTAAAPPYVGHSDIVQLGLRAEVVAGDLAAEVEMFGIAALSKPKDPNQQWLTLEQGRYFRGIAGGVHYELEASRLRFELGGGYLTGPTYVVMPRVEWEAVKTLYLELGAMFIGGRTPNWTAPAGAPNAFLGNPNLSIGGLYSDADQVFTGVRWVP